ncbi:MAG: hypothetical protein H6814_11065 [Phycisphaeraceae bacterium]|nr:hypothetical protein [Phycisphaeraceae bacterium]
MIRALILTAVAAILALSAPAQVQAAPEPSPVPTRWQLDLRPGPLRIATVIDETGLPRAYFYLTYDVVNNTGHDIFFAPSFELASEDGEIRLAGKGVPSVVTNELLARLRDPLLLDQISMATAGELLQGEENGRSGLVIWPADGLKVDEIKVFAMGFSGETRTITKPDTGEQVTLRKTLMMIHETPGEITGKGDRPLHRTSQRWILR